MEFQNQWLDRVIETLAEARAILACFGVDQPEIVEAIETALNEANALKQRTFQP
jgi:NAD(P)H-nitrite reductase large subunit